MKILALAASAALLLATSAQAADDRPLKTEVSVPTAGVDFRDAAEVAAFESRLARAARRACASGFDRDVRALGADRACAAGSLDRGSRVVAARAADKAVLTAQRTDVVAPAALARAD